MSGGRSIDVIGSPGFLLTQALVIDPLPIVRPRKHHEGVVDRATRDARDLDGHLELVLEPAAAPCSRRRRHARPADRLAGRRNREPGGAPQRVLRLLHVAEEHGEVDDARHVGFGELDATFIAKQSRHAFPLSGFVSVFFRVHPRPVSFRVHPRPVSFRVHPRPASAAYRVCPSGNLEVRRLRPRRARRACPRATAESPPARRDASTPSAPTPCRRDRVNRSPISRSVTVFAQVRIAAARTRRS